MSRTADVVIGTVLLLFGAALLVWLIPNFVGTGDQAILPRFIAACIAVLAGALIVVRLVRPDRLTTDPDPFIEIGGGEPLIVFLLAAIWCGFLVGTSALGFYFGGGLALVASFLALGVRSPVAMITWIGGTLLLVYLVFERLMSLTLPRGAIGGLLGF
jgi:hypothetical protein